MKILLENQAFRQYGDFQWFSSCYNNPEVFLGLVLHLPFLKGKTISLKREREREREREINKYIDK